MSFLSPWSAVIAAAIAVPLLLLLYFLKLRRRTQRLASTLLWREAFEDLQVNVPFQRLRFSILLLLQLLVLLLLLVALAEPVTMMRGGAAGRTILLIDRSASMSAPADDGTRLEAAKDAARDMVERLTGGARESEVMIIAFGRQARVEIGFDGRREALERAIDGIEPTDEQADLAAALQLAGAFATRGEDSAERPPDVVLISDGNVGEPEQAEGFGLRAGSFRYVRISPPQTADGSVDNIGIVSMSARRDYDDPQQVLVFARLINARSEPVEPLVTLLVDGETAAMERVELAPRDTESADGTAAPGEATVSFSTELATGAVLRVRHGIEDALAADDSAAVVLPAPARPRIAVVYDERRANRRLLQLLEEYDPQELRAMRANAYSAMREGQTNLSERFDLIVFDGVSADVLPGVPTLTIGAVPGGIDVIEPPEDGGQRVLSWDRQHPIMRYVSLDTIAYFGFGSMDLPPNATTLASGPEGPIIALVPASGTRHVVVGFSLEQSNWPLHVGFAVFMQNALDFLTLARTGQQSIAHRPGEPVTVRVDAGADEVVISGPVEMTVPAEGGEPVTLPPLRQVGLYLVEGAGAPQDRLAVSLLSDQESDPQTREQLVVNAESVAAGGAAEAAPRPLWPWFAAAAGVLLVVEWLVYCRLLRV